MKTFKLLDTFLLDGYYVTQNYGARKSYYAQFNLIHGHEGVDFGHGDKLKKARSPIAGTAFVGKDVNYGDYVVIEDYNQGCAVYLCHFDNIGVTSGQQVKAGYVLGEMGGSGNVTGEHVHFNFVILNESGSNKYRAKQWNWGFLDPRYPRDTNPPLSFAGVEQYAVQWVTQLADQQDGGTMPNMYKGYDLENAESMKVAVDVLVRLQNGEFVDQTAHDTALKELSQECEKRVSDGRTAEKLATIQNISRELSLPNEINRVTGLVSELKRLMQQSNNDSTPINTPPATLPAADNLKANGLVIEWEADGKKYKLNHSVKE
jgi:hypothetical protein